MFYWNLFFYNRKKYKVVDAKTSFNPCFIGTYSFTGYSSLLLHNLISVLILVLLELILLPNICCVKSLLLLCFNPCFIGTYSFTMLIVRNLKNYKYVLILVLLELILLQNKEKYLKLARNQF